MKWGHQPLVMGMTYLIPSLHLSTRVGLTLAKGICFQYSRDDPSKILVKASVLKRAKETCLSQANVSRRAKEQLLRGCRRAERSYSMFKVRRGGREEIPLVQGKEQWLCFAGAAVKRCPMSKVRGTRVRQ